LKLDELEKEKLQLKTETELNEQ